MKAVLKPVALGRLKAAGVSLADDPLAPYLAEFAVSGLLAAAALWYERDRDLTPGEFGAGIRAMLLSVMPLPAAGAGSESG